MVMSINIEGLSSVKQQIMAELCVKYKCDVLCMQETHRSNKAIRPRINGMELVADIPHDKYGSAVFVSKNYTCESTSVSSTDNIEIIQVQLSGVSVTSFYKPPNEQFEFSCNTTQTSTQVIIGDFNSHSTQWGYRSTNEDGTLVEIWAESNLLSLIHDAKQPKSFHSARWQQCYNPDLSFVSTSIAHQSEKIVMDVIPRTQHRPIGFKIKAAVTPQQVPFRRRYNFKKADWEGYAKSTDDGIQNLPPTPGNYERFVSLVKKASCRNIPRGCRTSYVCGLTDETKELYEQYQERFESNPFDIETTEAGDELSKAIAEVQRQKWQAMIESTDFTHGSRKAWKTINRSSKDYTQPQRQCKVTANQVAHQLLLNGKENSSHKPKSVNIPSHTDAEHSLTDPFTMEELKKGVKALANNKAAGLDDILCEQIKHLGVKTQTWLLQMMNNVMESNKFPKLWRKSRVIAILKPGKDSSLPKNYRPISLLCHTYKLFERMLLNRLNLITEDAIIQEQSGFRSGKSCTSQLLNLTQHIEDGFECHNWNLSAAYDTVNHKLLLNKLYDLTRDAKLTTLVRDMLSNRRFIVDLNGQKSRWRKLTNGLPQGSVPSPVFFNIYTNDQPIHPETRSFIYADDLCIAAQNSTFESIESTLSDALEHLDQYYKENHLRANPDKTQTCSFHLRNRETKRKLDIKWGNKELLHTSHPVYLGVTLDRTLSYKQHIKKVKGKTAARNNILKKLSNTKWGTSPSTIKTTALAFSYSTAEYACPVWERSTHAEKIGPRRKQRNTFPPPPNRKKNKNLYITSKARNLRKKKRDSWDLYAKSNNPVDYARFAQLRNQLRGQTRRLRASFEHKLAQDLKSNPKAFWKYVRSRMKTTSKISDLDMGHGRMTSTNKEKVDTLNSFFCSVFTRENYEDTPTLQSIYDDTPLDDITLTEEIIKNKLLKLNPNKSPGPDGWHPRVFKEIAEALTPPLLILLRKSLDEGSLPDDWKKGNITAIYKKGSKANPGNYRPISLTSIICKLLEAVIRDAIVTHMSVNNLFCDQQHGFVPGRSCITQLLTTFEIWTQAVENGNPVDAIYLDFQKASDSVPHHRLIRKLAAYGVTGKILRWIETFLTDRKQRVCVEGSLSNWEDVLSGIPQGSILGPTLFVMFINDMPDAITSLSKMFADDAKVFRQIENRADITTLQKDLDHLTDWSLKWQMNFNI